MTQPSDIGPVELVVLTFPGTTADPATVAALQDVVDRGYVTLLDLVYIAKDAAGNLTEIDVEEDLADAGLADLAIEAQDWISDDDLDVVRASLEPGTSAAIIVYEESWARRIATAARAAGGDGAAIRRSAADGPAGRRTLGFLRGRPDRQAAAARPTAPVGCSLRRGVRGCQGQASRLTTPSRT